jgi:hypothetical protein
MPYYKCPRDGSTEYYIATDIRQKISGTGGGGGGGGSGFTPPPTPIFNDKGRFLYHEHHTPTPGDPIHIDPIQIRTDNIEYNVIKCKNCNTILSKKDLVYTVEEIEAERKRQEEIEAERKREEVERKREVAERNAEVDIDSIFRAILFVSLAFVCLSLSFCSPILQLTPPLIYEFFCSPMYQAINSNTNDSMAHVISVLGLVATILLSYFTMDLLLNGTDNIDYKLEQELTQETGKIMQFRVQYKILLIGTILLLVLIVPMVWYYIPNKQSLWWVVWALFGFLPAIFFIVSIVIRIMQYVLYFVRVKAKIR